ncbi:unnamed protein product [Adineta ricciae]|uniref:PPPDE domain-containing protein n=1 Tax=Adineta ricciae TaxID=249248 RepID=A0A814DW79_ADIRI|nr:unnamed protein product [Adineta ricciae]CAF0959489.1 unnamed protein product [Adineta ricciae]
MAFSAEEHGDWRPHTGCKCPFSRKKLTELWLIEVPVAHPVVRGASAVLAIPFAPVVLASKLLFSPTTPTLNVVAHLAIECIYRCSQCGDVDYYTFEFSGAGKESRCGRYENISRLKSSSREMTLEDLYNIFLRTWPHATASDYNSLTKNCQHFATDMWAKI